MDEVTVTHAIRFFRVVVGNDTWSEYNYWGRAVQTQQYLEYVFGVAAHVVTVYE